MRLRELTLREAPGLPGGLPRLTLAPGLNVLVGPNASGKSTLSRAVRALLWEAAGDGRTMAAATFEAGGRQVRAALAHGRVQWEPGRPTLPPAEAASQYALGLVDLLRPGRADEAIARQLAVELAGGFDLEAALGRFNGSTQPPGGWTRQRAEARRKLGEAEAAQEELAGLEETLTALRRQRDAADEARRARRLAEQALDLARARTALAGLEAALSGLPEAAERLTGGELERLEELEVEAGKAQEELAEVGRTLERNAMALGRLRFLRAPPADDDLRRWGALAGELGEDLRDLRVARERLVEAEARERSARGDVWAPEAAASALGPEVGSGLTEGALDALEAELQAMRARQGQREACRRVAEAWASVAEQGEQVDEAALRAGVEALRGWLRTPAPETRRPVPGPEWLPGALVGGGAALSLLGIVAASVVLALLGGLAAGAGVALLVAVALWRPPEDGRTTFADEARRVGCAPEAWEVEPATGRLRELERRLDRLREQDVVRTRGAEAERAAAAAEREVQHFEAQLAARVRAVGLSERLAGATVAAQARAVARWLEARGERAAARARVEALSAQVGEAAGALRAWLGELGVAASERDEDLAGDVAAVRERAGAFKGLRAQRDELEQRRLASRRRSIDGAKALAAVWERAGLEAGDRAGLEALVAAGERRRRLLAEVEACRGQVGRLETEVGRLAEGRGAPADPLGMSEAEAEAWAAALEREAGEYEALVGRVAEIEAQVEAATRGRALEDARAELAEAEAGLRQARDERLSGALARLVLEEARDAQGAEGAPRVLARARAWFGAFTQHGWRLEVDTASDGGRFLAVETRSGQARELAQLSDATRVQLLLAARLAAVEAQEAASGPLPLCLDELLSTTDEARFLAVAGALLQLAGAGRQILYFTADAGEVAQWVAACEALGHARPHVVDLALRTGRGAAWGQGLKVAPAPAREVPAPEDGDDVDAYARRLGIEAPDWRAPAADWHLIHVLYDDLPALHRCVQRGVERLGPWREAMRAAPDALGMAAEAVARVEARARLLEACLDGLRVGRGRAVTWEDVQASGAVSGAFEERVRALLDEHGQDAAAFCAQVAALPRFRSASAQQLQAHLEEAGFVDPRPALAAADIVERALAVHRGAAEAPFGAPAAAAFVEGVLAKVAGRAEAA